MNKSVSATNLAKILFCKASIRQKASVIHEDMLRMNKGKVEHNRVKQTLRPLRVIDNSKESSLPDIKVSNSPSNLTIPTTLTFQERNAKNAALKNYEARTKATQ